MNNNLSTPEAAEAPAADTLAANFQVAELEPRLENSWEPYGYPDGGLPPL